MAKIRATQSLDIFIKIEVDVYKRQTQIQPPKKALEMAGIPENPGKLYWQGAGCDQCFNSGYRGRIGVFEVMLIQEELRRCILEGADRTRFLEARCV